MYVIDKCIKKQSSLNLFNNQDFRYKSRFAYQILIRNIYRKGKQK